MVKFYLLLGALLLSVLLKAQPVVTGLSPAANTHNAPLTGTIRISFSQPVEAAGEASLVVHGSHSGRIRGSYGGGGTTALTFQPLVPLKAGERITVTLTTALRSTGGMALARPYVYSFRARAAVAPVVFGPQQHLAQAASEEVETADLDGDGYVDIVSSHYWVETITLYINNGAGVFNTRRAIATPNANSHNISTIASICLADFNGDGYVDIGAISAFKVGLNEVYIFLNDGKGNFTYSLQGLVSERANVIEAGDLNGDGAADWVTGGGEVYTVGLNDGSGNFPAPKTYPAAFFNSDNLCLGDFDQDGDLDFVENEQSNLALWHNDGSGVFRDPKLIGGGGYGMTTAGDLNGDGQLELVSHRGYSGKQAFVYLNEGAGNLRKTISVDLGPQPMFTELADMDGDNDLDIIFVRWSDFVSVKLYDNISGDYTSTPDVVVGNSTPQSPANPIGVSVADLDGDLDLDLVTANYSKGTLSVLLNGGTQPVVSPLTLAYPAAGGGSTVSVSYPGNWTATSDQPWLVATPNSGSGKVAVTATAQANPFARQRTATLTVTGGGVSRTVSVTQAAAPPTLGGVNPGSVTLPAYGGGSNVSITSNAATTATADQDWIGITPAGGFGDRTVEVVANTNPTGNTRSGKVIVSTGTLHDTVLVSQAPLPPQVYGQMSAAFDQPGGTATLTIECNSDWQITNPGEWFTFSALNGRGNATVTVTAPANGSVYAKRIELTIRAGEAGGATVVSEPVVVYQHGVPVVFEVSPAPSVVYWGADAQSSSFTITTNADWTATSDRPWLSVSPASGTGTGTVTFSAPAHTGSTTRSTFVRIALPGLEQYKSFQVVQLPSYISPAAVAFAAQGESKTVQVSYSGNWSLSSTDPWLTISPASGSGPVTVTLTATTNPAGTLRSGRVTTRYAYAGSSPTQTLGVSQQGATLAVAPATIELAASGPGADGKASSVVTVSSNVSWSVSNAPAWLRVSPKTGTGNATLTLTAEANPSVDSRADSLTLTAGSLTGKVAITQVGVPLELTTKPAAVHFLAGGGNQTVEVLCNTDWQVAGTLPEWLQASTTSGKGKDSFTLSAGVNLALQVRTHTLTLTARAEAITLSVSQQAAQPFLTPAADTLLFISEGESKSLAVTANVPWTISELPPAETWYSVTTGGVNPAQGQGSGAISIRAKANPDTSSRQASVTLSGGGLSRTLTLSQPGTAPYLSVSADTVKLLAEGQEGILYISSSLSWQISGGASWLSVDPLTGKGSGRVGLSAPANVTSEPRSCTLTITAGSLTRRVVVSQSPKPGTVPSPVAGPGPNLVLAPNPAHHLLKLTIGQQTEPLLPVLLYNSLGQSVAAYALPVMDGQVETVLQVAHLPRGLYVLQVHTATGLQRRKLLLQ